MGWRETAKLITDSSLFRDSSPILQGTRAWKAAAKEVTTPPRLQGKQQGPVVSFTPLKNYPQIHVSNKFRESKWMMVLEAMAEYGLDQFYTWKIALEALRNRNLKLKKEILLQWNYDEQGAITNTAITLEANGTLPINIVANLSATYLLIDEKGPRSVYHYLMLTDLYIAQTIFHELFHVYSSASLLKNDGKEPDSSSGLASPNNDHNIMTSLQLPEEGTAPRPWIDWMKKDLKAFSDTYINKSIDLTSEFISLEAGAHDALDHLIFLGLTGTSSYYKHYDPDRPSDPDNLDNKQENYLLSREVFNRVAYNLVFLGKIDIFQSNAWKSVSGDIEGVMPHENGKEKPLPVYLQVTNNFPDYELKGRYK